MRVWLDNSTPVSRLKTANAAVPPHKAVMLDQRVGRPPQSAQRLDQRRLPLPPARSESPPDVPGHDLGPATLNAHHHNSIKT